MSSKSFMFLAFSAWVAFSACGKRAGECIRSSECGDGQVCLDGLCTKSEPKNEFVTGEQPTASPSCIPKTCVDLGAECGTNLPDGCGGFIASCGSAGSCAVASDVCAANFKCQCVPSEDAPDDAFKDTNCDGIDGDASKSIFVSREGNDSNPGTQKAPVASLDKALVLAQSSGNKAILLAEGSYQAPSRWESGVNLYGGYDRQFQRSDKKTSIAELTASASGFLVAKLTQPTVFERVQVSSLAATAPGSASQALRLVNSQDFLTLRHVVLSAASGADGSPGTTGAVGASGFSGGRGESANLNETRSTPSGGQGAAPHPNGKAGGMGGSGASLNSLAVAGKAGSVPGGAPGSPGCDAAVTNGKPGDDGLVGANGSPGADANGKGIINPNDALWTPDVSSQGEVGKEGAPGGSGGGGGGGGGMYCRAQPSSTPNVQAGGGGGGGGGGGAGGKGGVGGGGGGASIALTLVASKPKLENVTISTSPGGKGGLGGQGGAGGPGAAGGNGGSGISVGGYDSGNGGKGGSGGAGGQGGQGGQGARGQSVGIWCDVPASNPNVVGEFKYIGTNAYPSFAKLQCQ